MKGNLPEMQCQFFNHIKHTIKTNPITKEDILLANPW